MMMKNIASLNNFALVHSNFTVFGGYLGKLALASAVRAAVVEKTKTLSEGMNVIKGEFYQC